jgi:hypothetical protein
MIKIIIFENFLVYSRGVVGWCAVARLIRRDEEIREGYKGW